MCHTFIRARIKGRGVFCRLLSCAAADCSGVFGLLLLQVVLALLPCGDMLPAEAAAALDTRLTPARALSVLWPAANVLGTQLSHVSANAGLAPGAQSVNHCGAARSEVSSSSLICFCCLCVSNNSMERERKEERDRISISIIISAQGQAVRSTHTHTHLRCWSSQRRLLHGHSPCSCLRVWMYMKVCAGLLASSMPNARG